MSSSALSKQTLMARQPIFDAKMKTVAYELLYRSDDNNHATFDFSGSIATIDVLLNSYTSVYQNDHLTRLPAFINMTYDLIVKNTLPKLPGNKVVLEILEDIDVTKELINSVKSLRTKGYVLALDDFLYDDKYIPLIKLVQIIKIDVLNMSFDQVTEQVRLLKPYKVSLLAEKIEDHEMFEHCKSLGFKLFQGYFLAKPKIIKGAKASSSQVELLSIIKAAQEPTITSAELEKLILREPVFAFKLLRIVNSSANNLVREINSIQEAINILGIAEVKKWALIIVLVSDKEKPTELSRQLLIRGRMSEKVAQDSKISEVSGYMIAGMMSGVDALLDIEMKDLLTQVPLSADIKSAITENKGTMGGILKNTIDFSQGKLESLPANIERDIYDNAYKESLNWVSELMETVSKDS
jgi:EAL and modified HD-GYP domain-containing signal transduction protein